MASRGADPHALIAELDEDIARLERDVAQSDRSGTAQVVDEHLVATRMAARRARLSVLRAERATLVALLPEEER